MLDRSIIAQNITNLTDARYFAAWGVEYVSFNTIPDSPYFLPVEKIEEIKDWLEGPQVLIETNALEFDELADGLILNSIYSSMPLSKESFFRTDITELEKGLPDGKYIIKPDSIEEIARLNAIDKDDLLGLGIYIDISDMPITVVHDLNDFGIVVQGGDEEKPGVKSYDDLDELYDLLLN